MPCIERATDIVIGQTYLTWGGRRITVISVENDVVQWRDGDGNTGLTRVRGFASRVRKPVQ